MSMHRLSGCPGCAEPLEEGDRFCGVCGYALSSPPPDPDPTPTLPVTPVAGPGAGPAGESALAGGSRSPAPAGPRYAAAADPAGAALVSA
ncbi:serine/threonine-protein phosphatase, partial [Streptomyces sp. NPDC059104]